MPVHQLLLLLPARVEDSLFKHIGTLMCIWGVV